MNGIKKILNLTLIFIIVLIVSISCSDKKQEKPIDKIEEKIETQFEKKKIVTDSIYKLSGDLDFDIGNLNISVESFENTREGSFLTIEINNKYNHDINVFSNNTIINEYVLDTFIDINIEANKKEKFNLFFSKEELEKTNIKNINLIEIRFKTYKDDKLLEKHNGVRIIVDSGNVNKDIAYKKEDVIFDESGLKIIKIKTKNPFELNFLFINQMGKDINISTKYLSVNSNELDYFFEFDIMAGKKAIRSIIINNKEIIDKIKKIRYADISFLIEDIQNKTNSIETNKIKILY